MFFGSAWAISTDVALTSAGTELHATLQVPIGTDDPPIALILGGSGPTDRDGNSVAGVTIGSYRKLADALEVAGVATLRPDKRGVGASQSSGPESQLRFNDYVKDAQAWLDWLASQKRFGQVFVIGHSEGALIGLSLLQRPVGSVAGFVSLAAPGQPLSQILRQQLLANPANPPALIAEANHVLEELSAGRTVATVSPQLAPLFRPGVQPYLISEFQVDPRTLIHELKIPVLLLQGDRDLQVTLSDAKALAAAQPKAKLVLIKGMNHVLVDAPADVPGNVSTYSRSDLPLNGTLIREISRFLLQR